MKNTSIARKKLAQNLQIFRMNVNKKISTVSQETGISYSYLTYLENMKILKNPSMEMLDKLANYYKIDVYELFL